MSLSAAAHRRAPVALDRDDAAGIRCEQRARQPARPRTDLDDVHAAERPALIVRGGARDAPRHIQIEDEILPEAPPRHEPMPRDDLAQRRQGSKSLLLGMDWRVCVLRRLASLALRMRTDF